MTTNRKTYSHDEVKKQLTAAGYRTQSFNFIATYCNRQAPSETTIINAEEPKALLDKHLNSYGPGFRVEKSTGKNNFPNPSSLSPEIAFNPPRVQPKNTPTGQTTDSWLYLVVSPEGINTTRDYQTLDCKDSNGRSVIKYEISHYSAMWVVGKKVELVKGTYQTVTTFWNRDLLSEFNLPKPKTTEEAKKTLGIMGISTDANFTAYYEDKFCEDRFHAPNGDRKKLLAECSTTAHVKLLMPDITKSSSNLWQTMISEQTRPLVAKELKLETTKLDFSRLQEIHARLCATQIKQAVPSQTELDNSQLKEPPFVVIEKMSNPKFEFKIEATKELKAQPRPAKTPTEEKTIPKLQILQRLVKNAALKYSYFYKNECGILTNHGQSGQNAAGKLILDMKNCQTYEDGVARLADNLQKPKNLNQHSFHTFLLNEFTTDPVFKSKFPQFFSRQPKLVSTQTVEERKAFRLEVTAALKQTSN